MIVLHPLVNIELFTINLFNEMYQTRIDLALGLTVEEVKYIILCLLNFPFLLKRINRKSKNKTDFSFKKFLYLLGK